jgi:hypothetical protein
VSISQKPGPVVSGAQHVEFQCAVAMLQHSADRFEQIGALCETLSLLLKSPQLYESPWLASSQIEAILAMATESASTLDVACEQAGQQRTPKHLREVMAARASFVRSLSA